MSGAASTDRRFIRTVTGDIQPEDVGLAHCHEHTFILPGPSCRVNPELLLDDLDRAAAELSAFHAAGGRTVVDAQPMGEERAPSLQQAASQRSGVQIVATTGFHRGIYYEPEHFRFHEPAERLTQRLIEEITTGMCEYRGPQIVRRTEVRAGLLKFASDHQLIDFQARKAAEAVAAAHQATGAPILTHTENGTCGPEQVELFRKLGVAPSALLISHLDRNPDPILHAEIASFGAYLVYDSVGRTSRRPESTLVELIVRMVNKGHAGRILLGMDMGRRSMWRSYGGGPGMAYLADRFLPMLRSAGLGQEQVRLFTEHNPAAALAFRQPQETPPSLSGR